jgi:NADPH:quinone reductase-like Zn-dependent oxidoreductase
MRALQFNTYGGPEVLQWTEAPEPHAGPGQIRITVQAASVNPIDWKRSSGMLSGGEPMAGTGYLGVDAAGVVDEVGEDVTGVSVGDEVFGRGQHTQAESAVLDAWAAKAPSVDWAVAAAAGVAGETSERGSGCSTSPPATRCLSTVGRAVWGRSPCRWPWPEAPR